MAKKPNETFQKKKLLVYIPVAIAKAEGSGSSAHHFLPSQLTARAIPNSFQSQYDM